MKHLESMPIWRDATRLLAEIEESVREFPRYHKYTLGTELRATTMRICQVVHRAVSRQQSLGKQAGGWLKQARAEVAKATSSSRVPIHCAPASPVPQG